MKLSVRLLILVLIAALPVLLLQVHGLLESREQRKAAIAEQALQLARLAAAQQDQFIEAARYLLTAAAQFPEVQQRASAACNRRMAGFLEQFPMIAGIGAAAPDGTSFCGARGENTPVNIADRPYFQAALRTKSLAISGYIIGRRTGKPHLNFAYPALDQAGEVQAVVVLAFDLERLSNALPARPLPDDATMSLIDGDATLLARTPSAPQWIGQRTREPDFTRTMLAEREGVLEAIGIDGVERLYGFAPLVASADLFAVVGLPWQEAYRLADRLFWREAIATTAAFALAALAALICGELWIRRPIAGLRQAVRRLARGDLSARADPRRGSPKVRELAASFNDMARSLRARQADLEASEARLQAVIGTAADGIITINARGIIEAMNPAAERLFGYERGELLGHNVATLMPSPDRERHDEYLARYLRTGEARIIGIGREVAALRKDGSTLPVFLSIGEYEFERERRFTGILHDISERKRAEEHQRLLTAEIDHRAKNLLAAVQSMVMLTRPGARSVAEYSETLTGRLQAMSRAHDLLAREKWTGAYLHEMIRAEFQAYCGSDDERVAIEGDDVLLRPRAAQTLSMTLHELATNAAKYGALSVPGGQVRIRSTLEREELRLSWAETGGPEVSPPASRGFGTVVIERSVAHELGGEAELTFDRAGVRCELRVPIGDWAAGAGRQDKAPGGP